MSFVENNMGNCIAKSKEYGFAEKKADISSNKNE
jgi:hypothetical protein